MFALRKANADISAQRASQLVFDRLELVVQGMKAREWGRSVIAIGLVLTFFHWVAWPKLAFWFTLMFIGGIPASVADRRFLTRPASDALSAAHWQRIFCLVHLPCAAAWTSLAYFLWLPGNDLNHCMIIVALACTASAVGPLFGPSWSLSLTTLAVFGSGLLGALFLSGTPEYQAFALAFVVYLLLLGFMLRQIHASVTNTLLLRYENNELLVEQQELLVEQRNLIESKNGLIHDLAAANQVAEERRTEAERANKSKSQFLANMSHELRTPLNAILGFSEIIESRILGDNIKRDIEYARLIHHSGAHLLTLIDDILDLAKIEAESFNLVEKEVALDSVIAESVALLQHRAREGDCMLVGAVEPGLPAVRADERALKQILLNLLSNALKFTPPGGTVKAFVRLATDGRVLFGVADTGVGIATQDQAKIFEKFGQGRHAYVPKERGTGLGLAIVQGLIDVHGGEIGLESTEHVGTTVTIMLPACRTIPAKSQLPRSMVE